MQRQVGDSVTFISGLNHVIFPERFPRYGTRGKIMGIYESRDMEGYTIEWEDDTENELIHESMLLQEGEEFKPCPIPLFSNVTMTAEELNYSNPEFYPPQGAEGLVVDIVSHDEILVQWENGTTSMSDVWCIMIEHVMAI